MPSCNFFSICRDLSISQLCASEFSLFCRLHRSMFSDQEENRSLSFANTALLIRCLTKKLPTHLFRMPGKADFYEILHALMRSLSLAPSHSECVLVHPERQIFWDLKTEQTLEETMKKKMEGRPRDSLRSRGWRRSAAEW